MTNTTPALSLSQRVSALESIYQMMCCADRMVELGAHDRALEMYKETQDMMSLYREKVG